MRSAGWLTEFRRRHGWVALGLGLVALAAALAALRLHDGDARIGSGNERLEADGLLLASDGDHLLYSRGTEGSIDASFVVRELATGAERVVPDDTFLLFPATTAHLGGRTVLLSGPYGHALLDIAAARAVELRPGAGWDLQAAGGDRAWGVATPAEGGSATLVWVEAGVRSGTAARLPEGPWGILAAGPDSALLRSGQRLLLAADGAAPVGLAWPEQARLATRTRGTLMPLLLDLPADEEGGRHHVAFATPAGPLLRSYGRDGSHQDQAIAGPPGWEPVALSVRSGRFAAVLRDPAGPGTAAVHGILGEPGQVATASGGAAAYGAAIPVPGGIAFTQGEGAAVGVPGRGVPAWPVPGALAAGAAILALAWVPVQSWRLARTAQAGTARCLNCGARRDDQLAFCLQCGWRTRQESQVALAPADPWDKDR